MFIYFNENKCAYHKGQLAPFFIVFIIIIIIASLVTINIGKIAKTKTYSANSVDAGVLAAASTMASAFNYIAVANSSMKVNYQYFIGLASISFVMGYWQMTAAMTATNTAFGAETTACANVVCCPGGVHCNTCPAFGIACEAAEVALGTAIAELGSFHGTMVNLIVQVTGYWMLQYFFYRMIRDNINDYHQSAIDSGHSFNFSNSGISSKLRGCRLEDSSLCDACEDACERDCKARCGNRDDYDDDDKEAEPKKVIAGGYCFVFEASGDASLNIGKPFKDEYDDCMDACTREELNCLIADCDSQRAEYQLWVKNNTKDVPSGTIRTYSWFDEQGRSHDVASQVMIDSVDDYDLRTTLLPFPAEIALLWVAADAADTAIATLTSAEADACLLTFACEAVGQIVGANAPEAVGRITSGIAHVGLAPGPMFPSSSDTDAWPYLITWIDDVHHNFLVDVYQTQRHQGADLGVWSTEYPLVTSSSRANFAGTGKIHNPNPYYDATITLTDFLNGHLLPELLEPVKDVEGEIQAGLIDSEEEEEEEEENENPDQN